MMDASIGHMSPCVMALLWPELGFFFFLSQLDKQNFYFSVLLLNH